MAVHAQCSDLSGYVAIVVSLVDIKEQEMQQFINICKKWVRQNLLPEPQGSRFLLPVEINLQRTFVPLFHPQKKKNNSFFRNSVRGTF